MPLVRSGDWLYAPRAVPGCEAQFDFPHATELGGTIASYAPRDLHPWPQRARSDSPSCRSSTLSRETIVGSSPAARAAGPMRAASQSCASVGHRTRSTPAALAHHPLEGPAPGPSDDSIGRKGQCQNPNNPLELPIPLGRAMGLVFSEAGADVALAARTVEILEAAAKEIGKHGHKMVTIPTDVSDSAAVDAMVAIPTGRRL